MFEVGAIWNPMQAALRENLEDKGHFHEALALLLSMHGLLHCAEVSGAAQDTFMDIVWKNLGDFSFRTMPTAKDVTVAWNIWHITRIEDLTANLLIANSNQVLHEDWQIILRTAVRDTGNAMTDPEILSFSSEIDLPALRAYRNAVGRRTREIISTLVPEDLGHKFESKQISRILSEGGVTDHPDSIWLLDFWGRKNVAGILLMPITRHQMGHLNDCEKLKEKCKKAKSSKQS